MSTIKLECPLLVSWETNSVLLTVFKPSAGTSMCPQVLPCFALSAWTVHTKCAC